METDLLRRKMIQAFKGKGIPSDEMSMADMRKELIKSKLIDSKIIKKAKRAELIDMMKQFELDYKLKKRRSLKPKKKGIKYNLTVAQMKEIIKEKRPDLKISKLIKPELVKIIESIDINIPVYAEKAKRQTKRKPNYKVYSPEIEDIISKYYSPSGELDLEIGEKQQKKYLKEGSEERSKFFEEVIDKLKSERMKKAKPKKVKKISQLDLQLQNLSDLWEEHIRGNPDLKGEEYKKQRALFEEKLIERTKAVRALEKKAKKPKKPPTAYNLLVSKVMKEQGFKSLAEASDFIKSNDLYKKKSKK